MDLRTPCTRATRTHALRGAATHAHTRLSLSPRFPSCAHRLCLGLVGSVCQFFGRQFPSQKTKRCLRSIDDHARVRARVLPRTAAANGARARARISKKPL